MTASVTLPRQTFRKSERLCSRKILETLASKGKSIHIPPFRLVWLMTPLTEGVPVQVAFAVPKRNFKKAVDRNRIKRLMRESYRKNKSILYSFISDRSLQIALLLIFTGKEVTTHTYTESITKTILLQLAEDIKKTDR